MNEAVSEETTPVVGQPAEKPRWSRPAFDTLALEQTLNFAANTTDTTPVSKS